VKKGRGTRYKLHLEEDREARSLGAVLGINGLPRFRGGNGVIKKTKGRESVKEEGDFQKKTLSKTSRDSGG